MNVRRCCESTGLIRAVAAGAVLLLGAPLLFADGIKLAGGGSLAGSVTTGSKSVSVRTSTGTLIVFDRTAVKQVTRGHTAPPKAAVNAVSATAKSRSKKRGLTADEEAWSPKVRALVGRLNSGNESRSLQARNALVDIDATDAIPALSTYLGSSRDIEARHLYVVILHNMQGPKPVYYLVALSLFDPSREIRASARQALRPEELDSARRLFIAALRSGLPNLSRRAALALGDIGDPRGESVPYLIDSLVTYGTVASMRGLALYDVPFVATLGTTPGLKLPDQSAILSGQGGNAAPNADPTVAGQQKAASSGNPTPASSAGNRSAQSGGTAPASASNSQPTASTPTNNSSVTMVTSPEGDLYEPPSKCAKKHDRPLQGYVDHPEVLDALLKITDQQYPGYGFNQDSWRRWWANERTNRDLQKPAPDHVVAAGTSSH